MDTDRYRISSIPKKMKAALVTKYDHPLEIKEIDVPNPQHGQVLVKIEVTGVCHTDFHVTKGDWDVKCDLGRIPGHEGVGIVAALGPGVKSLKLGDVVCIPWLHKSCGACEFCWNGWETVCSNQLRTGFTANGTFAEYCVADAAFVGKVPEGLDICQVAPITCAGVTVYKGLKVSDVKPGHYVVIVGAAGGLGHLAIQYAKAMGMKVIAIDQGVSKMDFMTSLGADWAIDLCANKDLVAQVKCITGGLGAHGCLILSPSKEAVGEAVKYMRPLGKVVCISLPPGDFKCDFFTVVLNAVTICGSIVGTRLDLQEALEFAANGKVKCTVDVRKFDDVNQVLNDLEKGNINGRVVLKF